MRNRTVDLDLVERRAREEPQTECADAEGIHDDPYASVADLLQPRESSAFVAAEDRLVDLDLEAARRNPMRLQRLDDESVDAVAFQLCRREIDRDLPVRRDQCAIARRLADDPFADRDDKPRLLGDRDEHRCRHKPLARQPPAQHRLVADCLAGRELDLWLIDELEVVMLEGVAEPVLQRAPAGEILGHLGIEEPPSAPAVALGAIEGEVGIAHQHADVGAVVGRDRQSDRAADLQLVPVDAERAGEEVQHALGERARASPGR